MPEPTIPGGLKGNLVAAAFIAGLDHDEVVGYVLVAIDRAGGYSIATNRCCPFHATVTMANAIGRLTRAVPCGEYPTS